MTKASAEEGTLLLVCYDPWELDMLLGHLRTSTVRQIPRSRFPLYEGTLDGQAASAMRIPFGDDVGLLQTVLRSLLEQTRPRRLVSVGTAMACDDSLGIGDVLASRAAHWLGRSVEFGGWLAEDALAGAPHDIAVRSGGSVTTKAFVQGLAERHRLLAQTPGARVIEMEDFHVASLAAEFGAELASLRAVTDRGDLTDHMTHRQDAAERAVRVLRRALRQRRLRSALAIDQNAAAADLAYRFTVRSTAGPLDLPGAVAIARTLSRALELPAALHAGARVDLLLTGPDGLHLPTETPSGQAKVVSWPGRWVAVHDPVTHATAIAAVGELLAGGQLAGGDLPGRLRRAEVCLVPVAPPRTLAGHLPPPAAYHIQGLNSISAEPEEGLLAATTISEFRANGLQVEDASEAQTWIYRTANASNESYFAPDYGVPARTGESVPAGTTLIATGLGPAIDPGAPGGKQADLLVLGDEQGGRLVQILDELTAGAFPAETVLRYDGLAARLNDGAVALSRLDRRLILTPRGLNSLRFDPAVLRQIYSTGYDQFLERYFSTQRRPGRARASHLLMTSRGCGLGCSFCCSGGLQPFSTLDEEVLVRMLTELRDREQLTPGDHLDVYFLDSHFNRTPEHVIRLADRLEADGLLQSFEFFVRHSGLPAFLRRRAGGSGGGSLAPADPGAAAEAGAAPVVDVRLLDAYKRLGIDELVIGIDAYTDDSIRILKSSLTQLRAHGLQTRPSYTFLDIQAVLAEVEAAGLSARGFLLLGNPFAGEADRVGTFYNLAYLELRFSRFRVDTSSSEQVTELKPFPGAPLTELAGAVPGLIRDDRFHCPGLLAGGALPDFRIFGERRREAEAQRRFASALQRARLRLALAMAETLLSGAPAGEDDREESLCAGQRLLAEEARLGSELDARLAAAGATGDPADSEALRAALEQIAGACAGAPVRQSPAQRRFFELLAAQASGGSIR
jgi:nucleoside phosphorylase